MVPKKIHYCWFGNGEKSDLIKRCMATWKNVLPEYEIREWSEKDLEIFNDNRYVQQAYQHKKWAFVSDVFRLYALYSEGGIYLDTDVEIRKPFDEFLDLDFFIGSEKHCSSKTIGTAVIGACRHNEIIKKMLDLYKNLDFVRPDGSLDTMANTVRLVPVLKQCGASKVYTLEDIVEIDEKSKIYPINYFCCNTPESYSVHHFEGSWFDPWKLKAKISFPWFRNKRLVFYRYKNMKKDVPFEYPVKMCHKIFEYDYGVSDTRGRKILLIEEDK